ncbi:kinase-like domain-containing protein [Armillaria mellea]|nr:kinase-like domain-containing protein [Armillaria mellea]
MATSNSGTSGVQVSKHLSPSGSGIYSSESELDASEIFWTSHQAFLATVGYMLRPRYHPSWRPSWIRKDGTKGWRFRASLEDEHFTMMPLVLDAIRTKDKTKVVLRITRTDTNELSLAKRLCDPALLQNPRNHTVPILDIIPIPNDEEKRVFMVMPMLKNFNHPPFHCRSEFLDAFHQLLEGLGFMHSLNIAHVDVSLLNFLMDSSKVCPKGYHFANEASYDGVHWSLPTRPRYRVGPVRYYLIDFENAQEFPDGKENALTKRPLRCGVRSSPEFSLGLPCNPFKLDVYNAGATFLELSDSYHVLDEFKPLLLDMMADDPFARPNMAEALRRLDKLVSSNDKVWLHGRIWRVNVLSKPPSRTVQYLWREFPVLLPYF